MSVFSEVDFDEADEEFDELTEDESDDTSDDTVADAAGDANADADTPPAAEPVKDTAADDAARKAADDEKRSAHEESEAKRKAEWDAKQATKKAADEQALAEFAALSDDDAMAASVKRVGSDAERLTRRNMKICVTEHVQTLCLDDPAFARLTMHPKKNMVNCFHYINRKAREFMEAEMKDNDEKPAGWQGGDVPDDMCYAGLGAARRMPDSCQQAQHDYPAGGGQS
jgi:hypothetical protein